MGAGLPKYNVINLADLEKHFEAGSTVDLAAIEQKNILNISGRESKLPLKVRPPARPPLGGTQT
jgi:large subunit ribosomal protein L15